MSLISNTVYDDELMNFQGSCWPGRLLSRPVALGSDIDGVAPAGSPPVGPGCHPRWLLGQKLIVLPQQAVFLLGLCANKGGMWVRHWVLSEMVLGSQTFMTDGIVPPDQSHLFICYDMQASQMMLIYHPEATWCSNIHEAGVATYMKLV